MIYEAWTPSPRMAAVPFGRRRRIVPLPDLGVPTDPGPRDEADTGDVIAAGALGNVSVAKACDPDPDR